MKAAMTIEEERDQWMKDHPQPRVVHTLVDQRHRVEFISQEYDEGREMSASGTGHSYSEALLVALRNWEDRWGSIDR